MREFQERRKEVSDEVMRQYMTPRLLEWKGNPNPVKREKKGKKGGEGGKGEGEKKA